MTTSNQPLHLRCAACGAINRIARLRLAESPVCGRCRSPIDRAATPAEVDDAALQRLIKASPVPVLVDFWAPWCGPCKMIAPQITALAARYAGRAIVVKVNTDVVQGTAAALGIQAIPTLVVYLRGRIVERTAGAVSGGALDALLAAHVDSPAV